MKRVRNEWIGIIGGAILIVMQSTVILVAQSIRKTDAPHISIGMTEWSTQNLNVTHFRNGDPIPEARTEEQWNRAAAEGTPAWCYYNNDQTNGSKFGVLY